MRSSGLFVALSLSLYACGGDDSVSTPNPITDGGGNDVSVLPDGATPPDAGPQDSSPPPAVDGGVPTGWLYTRPNDNKIYVSNGSSGTVWMGRGVNMDDLFLCGYDTNLWMNAPETALAGMLTTLMTDWRPTFIRVSLSMNSFQPFNLSWKNDTSKYASRMTNFIQSIGMHPKTYVLVTLRSEASMVNGANQKCANGGDDAVCIPTNGTDDVYRSLVDTFKNDGYVLFGVSNEPGGNVASDKTLAAAMSHAVSVIRAEEDKLAVPHHLVSVQGNNWTSSIGFYDSAPLPYDNVVYEYHSYPPSPNGYTQAHIPVIIGEYGPMGNDLSWATSFYADVESKQIPNLAWDLDTYNDCAPDVAQVTHAAGITASPWGQVVKTYLNAH